MNLKSSGLPLGKNSDNKVALPSAHFARAVAAPNAVKGLPHEPELARFDLKSKDLGEDAALGKAPCEKP